MIHDDLLSGFDICGYGFEGDGQLAEVLDGCGAGRELAQKALDGHTRHNAFGQLQAAVTQAELGAEVTDIVILLASR